jgi:hypothetical protein
MPSLFKTTLLMLLPFCVFTGIIAAEESKLSADITLVQGEPGSDKQNKFQPVFPVTISAVVKNKGAAPSKPMQILVRYAYPQPYHDAGHSVTYETEKVELPAIQPAANLEIKFQKPHPLPTIADFVQDKWPMRQYQAVVLADGKEQVIGTLALTYSAYYYPIKARD